MSPPQMPATRFLRHSELTHPLARFRADDIGTNYFKNEFHAP